MPPSFMMRVLEGMAAIAVLTFGAALRVGIAIAIYDHIQTHDAVRRN